MLQLNPDHRPSASEILSLDFLKELAENFGAELQLVRPSSQQGNTKPVNTGDFISFGTLDFDGERVESTSKGTAKKEATSALVS